VYAVRPQVYGSAMTRVRRLLRKVGVGTYPVWFLVALGVTWVALTVMVGQALGRTERIMATGTGRVCGPVPCPPSMEILPSEFITFHPAFATGFVVGFLVVAAAVVVWRSLGGLARDDVPAG
jgi:hypothetical protein